jgi:hypothetical protein
VVTGTVFGSSVITAEKPSRHRKAPPTAATAPTSGSSAASSPPKITTITISVIGSDTTSARSVSACTCSLISRLTSGLPPILTLAPGISRSSCRSRADAASIASSRSAPEIVRSRSTTTTPARPSVATRPARAPAYGSTTRPTCGTRSTSAAAALILARTAGSAIATSSTRPRILAPYVALSPITSNAWTDSSRSLARLASSPANTGPLARPPAATRTTHASATNHRRRTQNRPIAANTPTSIPDDPDHSAPGAARFRPRRRPGARGPDEHPACGAGVSAGGGTFGR